MITLILTLPLLSAFCCGFLGFLVGRAGSFVLSNLFICFSFLLSLYFSYFVICCGDIYYVSLGSWFESGSLSVMWSFMFDQLACVMIIFVLLVSLLVHFYSCGYMFFDPHSVRFMSYLSLFTFFMLILVSADNFVVFFVGWEGVGLCSFLLISFWTTRQQAVKAAMKALIINRIGDFWLLFSIALIFLTFGSVDFLTVFF